MNCAVITPVGPGHERLLADCAASVTAAARTPGLFSQIWHQPIDDTQGHLGRSAARNTAVREAQAQGADWVFFLDADDLLLPDAFVQAAAALPDHDGVWGAICALDRGAERPLLRDKQEQPIRDVIDLLAMDPFHSLQMGHFVRTEVALQQPFDERLDAGEDFAYYLRVWLRHRCCKLRAPLFVNRRGQHSQGPRSATAANWRSQVTRVMLQFLEEHRTQLQDVQQRRCA